MTTEKSKHTAEPMDEVKVCQACGNTYTAHHIKEGDDWNDFGYRYCPFCGLVIDEYATIT